MIDTISIGHYNKTLAYTKKRYRPYDDREIKAMQEAAPLLKFTLEKQTRSLEEQNIKHALQVAASYGVYNVIIAADRMQFFNASTTNRVVDRDDLLSALKIACSYSVRCERKDSFFVQVQAGFGYGYEGILMEGSRNGGAYVRDGEGYRHIAKSKDIMQHIWDQGYIAQGTRTPQVVSKHEFSFDDVEEVKHIMNVFESNQLTGKWSAKFMRILSARASKIRFPGYAETLKRMRTIINSNKI